MILTWLLLDLTPSLEYVVFRVYVYIAFLVNAEYCMCYGITRRSFSGSHEFLWKMPLISYSTQVEWLFFFILNWYHFQILVIKNIFFNLVLLLQKNKLRKNSKKRLMVALCSVCYTKLLIYRLRKLKKRLVVNYSNLLGKLIKKFHYKIDPTWLSWIYSIRLLNSVSPCEVRSINHYLNGIVQSQ